MQVHCKSNQTFLHPFVLSVFFRYTADCMWLNVMPYACLHDSAHHCAETSFKDCILQLAAARQHDALVLASAGPRFHQKSGVWSDTQAALQDRGNDSGLVTQLDPDATTRCLTTSCCHCVTRLLFPDAGWSRDCLSRALLKFCLTIVPIPLVELTYCAIIHCQLSANLSV